MPLSNGDEVASQVADLRDDIEDACDDGTDEGMDDVAASMQQVITAQDAIASGRLWLEAQSQPLVTGNPQAVGSSRISIPGVYKYVEWGTGLKGEGKFPSPDGVSPNMVGNLQDWIDDKGITGQSYSANPADGSGDHSPLAQAIAVSIAAFGTTPHPFIRPVWYSNRGKHHVRSEVERRINRAIRRS